MSRFACAFSLLLLAACNTLPVGADQLDRFPASDSLTLAAETTAGYSRYVGLGSADTMFLGRDEEYQSRVLIRFPLADTALEEALSLRLVLHRADSSPCSFVIRPCSSMWNANAVSWRMADSVTQWLAPGGDFWDVELGSGAFEEESIVVALDLGRLDSMVWRSFREHGLFIIPRDTGFLALHSGSSQTSAPRLLFSYPDDETTSYTVSDDAHLVDTFALRRVSGTRVGSGVAFRTYLKFNLDSIPAAATIARARLSFVPQIEYRRRDTLGIGVRRLLEPYGRAGRNARFADTPAATLSYAAQPDSAQAAVLDLRRLVQFWTANPDSNFGMLVVAEPEWAMMFRLGVARTGPAAPALEVLYVMPPEDRLFR